MSEEGHPVMVQRVVPITAELPREGLIPVLPEDPVNSVPDPRWAENCAGNRAKSKHDKTDCSGPCPLLDGGKHITRPLPPAC